MVSPNTNSEIQSNSPVHIMSSQFVYGLIQWVKSQLYSLRIPNRPAQVKLLGGGHPEQSAKPQPRGAERKPKMAGLPSSLRFIRVTAMPGNGH